MPAEAVGGNVRSLESGLYQQAEQDVSKQKNKYKPTWRLVSRAAVWFQPQRQFVVYRLLAVNGAQRRCVFSVFSPHHISTWLKRIGMKLQNEEATFWFIHFQCLYMCSPQTIGCRLFCCCAEQRGSLTGQALTIKHVVYRQQVGCRCIMWFNCDAAAAGCTQKRTALALSCSAFIW